MLHADYQKFCCIYEVKSLSQAAAILDCNQASLSKLIQRIEIDTKLKLFIRTNRGLLPTESADKLYRLCQSQALSWNEFLKPSEYNGELQGQFTLGGHSSIISAFSNPLANFMKSHKNLGLNIVLGRSPEVIKKIQNHELDLGLVASPTGTKFADDLIVSKLAKGWVAVFACQKEYDEKTLFYNPVLINHESILKTLSKNIRTISVPDYFLAAQMARAANAMVLLPHGLAQSLHFNEQIGLPKLKAQIFLIYRSEHRIKTGLSRVYSELKKALG